MSFSSATAGKANRPSQAQFDRLNGGATQMQAKKNIFLGLLAAFLAVMGLAGASSALAKPAATTAPSVKSECYKVPADATVVVTKTSKGHTKVVVKKSIKSTIRQYEIAKNVVVAINMRPNGVRSAVGCVDSARKGWIKPGDPFLNTR